MKSKIVEFTEDHYDYVFNCIKDRWNLSNRSATKYINDYLHEVNCKCFVALVKNMPVGMGVFAVNNDVGVDVSPWVMGLWVDPEYRGHGIGSKITKARFKYAKELGYNRMYLDTQSAKDYHLKFGWIDTGIIGRYQGEPSIIMIHGL